jgi:hypothetical protein
MLRTIGGILAGIVAALAAVYVIEVTGHIIFPLPPEVRSGNLEILAASIETLPTGLLAFVALAWFAGALAGGIVAGWITGLRGAAWFVAAIVAAAAIFNIVMIPHPAWMQLAAVIAPMAGGLIAGHLTTRGRPATPSSDRQAQADG